MRKIRVHHLCELPGTDEGKLVLSFKRKGNRGWMRCFGTTCGPNRDKVYVSAWSRYCAPARDSETFRFLGYL